MENPSESQSSFQSDLIHTLMSKHKSYTCAGSPVAVVHTSSIPLASTINLQVWKAKHIEHDCKSQCCWKDRQAVISENCPCKNIANTKSMKHLCFLEILPQLGEADQYPDLKFEEILFCSDQSSIFEKNFAHQLVKETGQKGWNSDYITEFKDVHDILMTTYWYRCYQEHIYTALEGEWSIAVEKLTPVRDILSFYKNAIETVNGLLIKQMLAIPEFCNSYRDLADTTFMMFRDLIFEYFGHENYFGAFEGIKDLNAKIKSCFNLDEQANSFIWLEDYSGYRGTSLQTFWEKPFAKFFSYVIKQIDENGTDYTKSLSWINRCSILSQSKYMGYIPDHLGELKRQEYHNKVSREPLMLEKREALNLYNALKLELRYAELPTAFFAETKNGELSDLLSQCDFPVKQTASADSRVARGGRLEDARIMINYLVDHKVQIRTYGLIVLRVEEVYDIADLIKDPDNYPRDFILFWTSFQIILNYYINKGFCPKDTALLFNDEHFKDRNIFDGRVLHIREPGKNRDLMMSSSILNWFLTPASKIFTRYLGKHPDHTDGLLGASQDWRFNMKMSGDRFSSGWLYGESDIYFHYCDWKEATDYCSKYQGNILLKAQMDYTTFPAGYGELVRRTVCEEQPIVEESFQLTQHDSSFNRIKWKQISVVRDGFMMGNPMTKVILHCFHMAGAAQGREILTKMNFYRRKDKHDFVKPDIHFTGKCKEDDVQHV